VAKKGAICPIFEGDMPPKKCTPKIGANIGAITGILLKVESPFLECCIASYYVEHNNMYPGKMSLFAYCLGLDMWQSCTCEECCLLTLSDLEVDRNGDPF
jgi:hypothetical protein